MTQNMTLNSSSGPDQYPGLGTPLDVGHLSYIFHKYQLNLTQIHQTPVNMQLHSHATAGMMTLLADLSFDVTNGKKNHSSIAAATIPISALRKRKRKKRAHHSSPTEDTDSSDSSSSDDDADEKRKRKRKKKKVGLRDLGLDRQKLLKHAIVWFQSTIILTESQLTGTELDTIAIQTWTKELTLRGITTFLRLIEDEVKLVCIRCSI